MNQGTHTDSRDTMNQFNTSVAPQTAQSPTKNQYQQIFDFLSYFGFEVGDTLYGAAIKIPKDENGNQKRNKHGNPIRYINQWKAELGEDDLINFRCLKNTNTAKKKGKLPKNPEYEENGAYFVSISKTGDKEKWATDGLKILNNLNNDSYNIYFIPNGAFLDEQVKTVIASFWEGDAKSKDEQREDALNAPIQPNLILDSGNKSLHCYYILDKVSAPKIEEWRKSQGLLISHYGSDSSIKNPSRRMRMPTFKHPKTGEVASFEVIHDENFPIESLLEAYQPKQLTTDEISHDNQQQQNQEQSQQQQASFIRAKTPIPETINESNDKLTNCIHEALSFFGAAGQRQPGEALQGRTKDKEGNIRNHYDECISVLGALKRHFKDDEKASQLMTHYLGDAENWEAKASGMSYNRCPGLGTLFHVCQAYGYEFPEDHIYIKTYRGLLNAIRKNEIKIAYNKRSLAIEYDGVPLTKGQTPAMILSEDYHIEAPDSKADQCFYRIARENEYDPIHLELEAIRNNAEEGKIEKVGIDDLSTRYLGTSDPIYDTFFKKFLIAMVARIYQPGCKVDNCLILQGGQNVGKSTLLEILTKGGREYNPDPFYDGFNFDDKKDEIQSLNQSWLIELAEIDFITNKKEASKVKAFLTKKKDKMRLPYARETEDYPRHNVFAGTTNKEDFLNDPTGWRRFWVIPVQVDGIDLKTFFQERDGILASAIEAYMNGEQWHLTEEEYAASEANNQHFQMEDTVKNHLEEWIQTSSFPQTRNGEYKLGKLHYIIHEIFDVMPKDCSPLFQKRVKEGLESLGCKKKSVRNEKGITEKQYVLSEKVSDNPVTSVTSVTNQQNSHNTEDFKVTKNVTSNGYKLQNPVTDNEGQSEVTKNVTSNHNRLQIGYISEDSHTGHCNFVTNVTGVAKSFFRRLEVDSQNLTFLTNQGFSQSFSNHIVDEIEKVDPTSMPDNQIEIEWDGMSYVVAVSDDGKITNINEIPF